MPHTYFVEREWCPGCKSTKCKTIYSCSMLEPAIKGYLGSLFASVGQIEFEYLGGAEFILEECLDCGLIYQREIPNEVLIRKIYEEWIDPKKTFDNHEQDDNLDHYAQYAQEVMMLVAYFKVIPSRLSFFDFGMGWGKWCRMAKAFGCDAYGTDLSEARIEYATRHGIKTIAWEEIPIYRFDFINAEQVFEHISKPLETLCHLKKSLKPEGLIKISVPDGRDIKRRLEVLDWTAPLGSKNSLNPVSPLSHLNCFNHAAIIRMADAAGLKLTKIPIGVQYLSNTNWKPIKPILKNLLRPLYRNILQRSTYLFFRPK